MNKKTALVLTANPGVDRTMFFGAPLESGAVNRAVKSAWTQGSKGGNGAIILSRLGTNVTYLTFTGGPVSSLCLSFTEKEGIFTKTVETVAGVRVNVKISDGAGTFTECNEAGGPVSGAECERMLSLLRETPFDSLLLAGSLPAGAPTDFYATAIGIAKEKGAWTVLDTDGEPLKKGLAAEPDCIKPNEVEFTRLMGKGLSLEEKIKAFHRAYKKTALLLSLGGDGAIYSERKGDNTARVLRAGALHVCVRGTVGAGDTLLAAFISEKMAGNGVKNALISAISAAAAKVACEGSTLPDPAEMLQRRGEVEVKEEWLTL